MPAVLTKVGAARKTGVESRSTPRKELAEGPTRLHVAVMPDRPFLVMASQFIASCLRTDLCGW